MLWLGLLNWYWLLHLHRGSWHSIYPQRIRVTLKSLVLSSRHLWHVPQGLSCRPIEEVRSVLSSAPILPPSLLQQLWWQVNLKLVVGGGWGSPWGLWYWLWSRDAWSSRCTRSHGEAPWYWHLEWSHVLIWMDWVVIVLCHIIVDMLWKWLRGRGVAGPSPYHVLRHGGWSSVVYLGLVGPP